MNENPYEKYMMYNGHKTPFKDCNNKIITCGDYVQITLFNNRQIKGVVSIEDDNFVVVLNVFERYLLRNYTNNKKITIEILRN